MSHMTQRRGATSASSGLEVVGGTQIITVRDPAFFTDGELDRRLRDALRGTFGSVVIDLTSVGPLDEHADAQLEAAWRRLARAAVDLVIVCPFGGLAQDRAAQAGATSTRPSLGAPISSSGRVPVQRAKRRPVSPWSPGVR